jgi:hypothetical protein
MADATGVAEAMLGLPGFRVLGVEETATAVIIQIETSAELVGRAECGVVAVAQDRMVVEYRDLAAFGRPGRLRCQAPLALRGAPLRGGPGPSHRPGSRRGACSPTAPAPSAAARSGATPGR